MSKKIEEAKRAAKFLFWLRNEIAKYRPAPIVSLQSLDNAIDEVEGFINFRRDGRYRKAGVLWTVKEK
jgi:hypothetical protein